MDSNTQQSPVPKQNINGGTKLCIISLFCMFVAPILIFFIAGMFMNGDISGATAYAYSIITHLWIVSYIAAWVLVIVSRVKYKDQFSLVLIIIYGSLLLLSIIGAIVLCGIIMGLF